MPERIRLAVLGLGFMGQRYAAIAADVAGGELTAVCDADEGIAREAASRFGVSAYTDVNQLLDAGVADAIVVAVPESAQVPPTLAAAEAGLHVLLEKPVASTPADLDRLATGLAGTAGTHASAHLLRADPRYVAAAEAVHAAGFGDVVHITGTRRSRLQTARRVAGRTSLLYYLGVHDLDAVAWLAGSPVRTVQAVARRPASWPLDVDATILALLECESGAIAQVELTWATSDSRPYGLQASMVVVGTGGTIEIRGGDEVLVADGEGQRALDALHWPEAGGRVLGTLRYQLEQWLAAIDGRCQVAASIEDGMTAARVAFAIEEALQSGRPAQVAR